MADIPSVVENDLLASLAPYERERLAERMESVQLKFGDALHHTGEALNFAWFPTSSVLSLMRYSENGDTAEVALTGCEGAVGVAALLASSVSTSAVLVKRAGHAFRCPVRVLRDEVERSTQLRNALLIYVQALLAQLAQTGMCNRLHNTDERLCRCLLQLLDRQQSNRLVMTHEFLSRILGVRRVGVTEALQFLQSQGAISMTRGCIEIRNRDLIERRTCECYAIIREETARFAPSPYN